MEEEIWEKIRVISHEAIKEATSRGFWLGFWFGFIVGITTISALLIPLIPK